jgi:hypothetical protein
MSRQSVICPNCAEVCDPDEGVACRACGAFLGASPFVGSARDHDQASTASNIQPEVVEIEIPKHRWPWRRGPGDDLLPDAERRRRRWRRIGGGSIMLALSLGTTAWWQSLDDANESPSAVAGAGVPELDVVDGFDRVIGRDLRVGAEQVLADVYRPASDLYVDWGDWSQVTPAAIGESITELGLLAAPVAPERADEISMLVEPNGIVLGALDLESDNTDCVWLRDQGLGPEIVHDNSDGSCSAERAPSIGWEPVEI